MIRAAHSLVIVLAMTMSALPVLASRARPELVIEAPEELGAVVEDVRKIARGDFSSALFLTGVMGFNEPIRVVLAAQGGPIEAQTPGWISGFADGGTRTIVLFPGRVSRYPDDSLVTLVHHEIAHILVGEAARGHPVPRWFNEGLATVAAREWGIEDRARYAAAVVGRGPRTTAELDQGFADGGRRASRSYALSGAFVRWMRVEYGEFVTPQILERIGRGMSFAEAFVRTTGDTVEIAEHGFFVREALWHTWVPFLTSSGVLWAAITGLALIAIRRRRQKSAEMHERWDAEEEKSAAVLGASEAVGSIDFTSEKTLDDADDDVVN